MLGKAQDKPEQDAWEARSPAPQALAVLPAARAETQTTSKASTMMTRQTLAKQGAPDRGRAMPRDLPHCPAALHMSATMRMTCIESKLIDYMALLAPAARYYSMMRRNAAPHKIRTLPTNMFPFPHSASPATLFLWHLTFSHRHSCCNTFHTIFPRHHMDPPIHHTPTLTNTIRHTLPNHTDPSTTHPFRLTNTTNTLTPHCSTQSCYPQADQHHQINVTPTNGCTAKNTTAPPVPTTTSRFHSHIVTNSKCMTAGYLTYLSLPPPNTNTIHTTHNTYLKTLGLLSNTLVCYILQTFSKIQFSYINTHGTNQAARSLVPWSDHVGAPHLVVGSGSLDHDSSVNSMPQFLLVPLLCPTTQDIAGSYDDSFITWLATIRFLAAKNQALSLHIHHSLFDTTNLTGPGPSHLILSQLCNDTVWLSTTMAWLQSISPTPECHAACLPFIFDVCLTCLPAAPPPLAYTGATTPGIRDFVHALKQPAPNSYAHDESSRSTWSWRILLACVHSDDVTVKYTIHLLFSF
eukprot:jgi/Psemu1/4634/gm1.4634_g